MKIIILMVLALSMSQTSLADHSGGSEHSHSSKVEKVVKVEIGKKGFKAESPLNFKSNESIVLNITRTTDKTCMTSLKHPKTGKLVKLPLNKQVRFEVGEYSEAKEVKLLCGMGMKAGVLHISAKPVKKG